MESIERQIREKLDRIETEYDVKILHCIESGSRAWGFASPDSDFDVRFFYVHKPEFYLRLDRSSDVINYELNDVFDINGWDLQKALRLLYKSNPTIFEWNSSPIVYRTTPQWQRVQSVIDEYFLSKSGLYHYLSMANSNYKEYLKGDTVRLKKYFYVIRPVLACLWILEKNSPPPMLFSELVSAELDKSLMPYIDYLFELKTNSPESEYGKKIPEINSYLDLKIKEISGKISETDVNTEKNWDNLNRLFLEILRTT